MKDTQERVNTGMVIMRKSRLNITFDELIGFKKMAEQGEPITALANAFYCGVYAGHRKAEIEAAAKRRQA